MALRSCSIRILTRVVDTRLSSKNANIPVGDLWMNSAQTSSELSSGGGDLPASGNEIFTRTRLSGLSISFFVPQMTFLVSSLVTVPVMVHTVSEP